MQAERLLTSAKKSKADEFYTQLSDIEAELRHYKEYFKGQTVFCNCDDPYESNFFKYFVMNFNYLGLKKLIATCYAGSPIANTQLSLFDDEPVNCKTTKSPHKIEISEVGDYNQDGAYDLLDVEYLLRNNRNILTRLEGDGDFRSGECVDLLRQADIVVTNPPFSLFREYIGLLAEYNKKFIIIGNTNALTYKEVFRLFKENKISTGHTKFNVGMFFLVPDSWENYTKIVDGKKYARVSTSCWFSNLPVSKHNAQLTLYKKYTPAEYPKYDNFDAINVDTYSDIPEGYDGVMGVPVTFLDKYNPAQFEIVGITKTWDGSANKTYPPQIQVNANGTRSKKSVTKLNDGAAIKVSEPPVDKTHYIIGDECFIQLYARVLIRHRRDV